jgi:hypothetical protein
VHIERSVGVGLGCSLPRRAGLGWIGMLRGLSFPKWATDYPLAGGAPVPKGTAASPAAEMSARRILLLPMPGAAQAMGRYCRSFLPDG